MKSKQSSSNYSITREYTKTFFTILVTKYSVNIINEFCFWGYPVGISCAFKKDPV